MFGETVHIEIGALAEQVNQLNTIAMAGELNSDQESAGSSRQRSAAIQSVIVDTKDAEDRFTQARNKTTVFFQFAGGSREHAEALSAALKKNGYIVPGEDRESGAAGKHEIRYFHEEDKAEAIRLAENMNRALANSEFRAHPARVDIIARSFVSYHGKKPRPGVLELWLEIPSM